MPLLPANISRFDFFVSGLSAELRVVGFTAHEQLSRPFLVELELASEDDQIDFAQLNYKTPVHTLKCD
jgi:uncharacterized protein involved in type VI secretion and phage assembly